MQKKKLSPRNRELLFFLPLFAGPCDHIKQSIKLFAFTTEAQRSQRGDLFVCRGGARQTKASVSNKLPSQEAGSFMENRYLPILHESIPLSVLSVSNEPLFSWGEWAVKIVSYSHSMVLGGFELTS